jgi:hypothetical protein
VQDAAVVVIPFEFGVRYGGILSDAKIGPLSGVRLWSLLKDGRTLGFMARHIMEATFCNVEAMPDDFGYSLMVRGTDAVMQTRMVTNNGCDLLMAKMKGVGRQEQRQAQAEWERRLTGWVFIDNRQAPFVTLAGVREVPRDKASLRVSEWERLVSAMPQIRLDWSPIHDRSAA